jgi:hypothetical protein
MLSLCRKRNVRQSAGNCKKDLLRMILILNWETEAARSGAGRRRPGYGGGVAAGALGRGRSEAGPVR